MVDITTKRPNSTPSMPSVISSDDGGDNGSSSSSSNRRCIVSHIQKWWKWHQTIQQKKQTEIIWSPALSLPSRAAAPPSITFEMKIDYNTVRTVHIIGNFQRHGISNNTHSRNHCITQLLLTTRMTVPMKTSITNLTIDRVWHRAFTTGHAEP